MNSKEVSAFRKLNLGSGSDIREGWINLNIVALPGVDVVHNIEHVPLPFGDAHFDEIEARDILEHVEYMPVLKELHRILAPGGQLHIRVPHFTSRNNYTDPTHKKRFSVGTFDYFAKDTYIWRHRTGEFYFDFVFSAIKNRRINFDKTSSRWFKHRHVVEWLVNRSYRAQEWYEMSGFSWRFPAADITITLVK